ncbi:MAG: S9 family peptidase [Chitinophagales bacterium]
MKNNVLSAEHLYDIKLLQSSEISPDGKYILYAKQTIDKKTEKKYSNLWLVASDGQSLPQQFTAGKHSDSQATWSPDGKKIAFVSNRVDTKQAQIFVIPLGGGEATAISDIKGEIALAAWSPDGKKILFNWRKKDAEAIERDENPEKKELGIVAYHYTRTFYRFDGYGYLPKTRWNMALIDVESAAIEELTNSDVHDIEFPTFSPDGKHIAYISNCADEPDLAAGEEQLFLMNLSTKNVTEIPTNESNLYLPSFSPDGKHIAYLGVKEIGQWWQNIHLWVVETDGSKPPECLTESYDITIEGATLNDLGGTPALTAPVWTKDGKDIYVQTAKNGSNIVSKINVESKVLQDFFAEKGVTGSVSFDKNREKMAAIYANMSSIGQIIVKDSNETKTLTQTNQKILSNIDLGKVEEVWFTGADNNQVQGWIMFPPNFDATKKYPSILEIHGGPLLQYGEYFMHEFYYLAAQGYVVYFCNPRGGKGYGEAHAKAIWNDWGGADYADLMVFADLMAEKSYIDTENMGVTGGSYGGYMTCWIIGHTTRFKAAVTQRCVSNLLSMWGSSDVNWVFQQIYKNETPWENPENYWRMSPMKYIGNAKTPTLVIHSENDYRCALEQGQQVYVALKKLGVDTELVIFPNEPHGLSRNGRTDRRIVRLQHIARWFNKYLK